MNLNLGSEVLSDEEIKVSPEEIDSVLDRLDKSSEIFVYSEKPESSKAVCKKLGLDGYTIINLVEPFSTASRSFFFILTFDIIIFVIKCISITSSAKRFN